MSANSDKEVAQYPEGLHIAQPGKIISEKRAQDDGPQPAYPIHSYYSPAGWSPGSQDPSGNGLPPRERNVCGVKRSVFFLVVVLSTLFIMALIIGLGVGLGVGLPKAQANVMSTATSPSASPAMSPTAASSSSPVSSSTTTSITTTSTNTAPTTTPTGFSGSSPCPSGNGTLVTPRAVRSYRVYCGADISTPEKTDLAQAIVPTFSQCLDICDTLNWFQNREDVAAVFNWFGTGGQTPGTCWCIGGANATSAVPTEDDGNTLGLLAIA